MDDFFVALDRHKNLSEVKQKQAGKAIAGKMQDEHENFMQLILKMLDEGTIDVRDPNTFLNMEVYEKLDDEWKSKVDVAMVNMADLLRHIVDFRVSKHTPDESPQLETMIEHLWQMKQRIEEYYDVFKF